MAPKPGADGLIAQRAKVTSAGGILALVTAVLLALSGCGGGGSSSTTASAPGSEATSGAQQSPTGGSSPTDPSSSSSPSSSAAAQGAGSKQPSASTPAPGQAPAAGSAKHGPPIAAPKGTPERGPTPAEREQVTVADIALSSPALPVTSGSSAPLSATYTCDGKGSWPALHWQGIPSGTQELALFVMNVAPVEGKLFFDWAVAGLDPSLEGLEAGALPRGAIKGKNSFGNSGYEICPPRGGAETYLFALFALPKRLSPHSGFDARTLRDEALGQAGNVGLLAASYARG
jgi:phosphatidylethanolamine-binding protein (PEBP) family uncharacterized protein